MKKKFIAFTKTRLVIGSLIMIFAIFQSPSFASSPVPQSGQAEASIKDETIFVNLGNDGGVEAINVINTFYRPAGEIRDYGDYVSIVNLTNAHEPAIEGNRITFKVDEEDGNFNYQGELANRELPWLFEITYKLDGKKIDVQHLIGAAGHMQIILDVRQNTDALEYFRENYMLQINIPLEMDKASTVYAPGATMTVVGNTITLAFTLFPGESRMFVVEADVENFEMGGIEIAAIKAQMSLGQLEQDMLSGFDSLADGMGEMVEGTAALRDGTVSLNEGLGQMYDAVAQLDKGRPVLLDGMEGYVQGLSGFTKGISELEIGSERINAGLYEMTEKVPLLLGGYRDVENALTAMLTDREALEQLALTLTQNADPQVRVMAEAMLGQLAGLKQVHHGIIQSNTGLAVYSEGIEKLAGQYSEFARGVRGSADGAYALENGFYEILTGTREVLTGVGGIREGIGIVKENTTTLPNDVQKLIDGQHEMKDGINQAKDEIADFTGDGEVDRTVSFVSPEKGSARSVQFVFRTPPVEVPEMPVADENVEADGNLRQRFISLFSGMNYEGAEVNLWQRFIGLFRGMAQ